MSNPAPLHHIAYRMERGDFVALAQTVAATPPLTQAIRIAAYFAFLLLVAFIGSGLSLDNLLRNLGDTLVSPVALLYLLAILVVPALLLAQRQLIALFATATYRKSAIADRDMVVDLDTEGLDGGDKELRFRYAWGVVTRLVETPAHLFVFVSPREAMIIPRRAIPNDDQWRNLIGFIRARTGLSTARG